MDSESTASSLATEAAFSPALLVGLVLLAAIIGGHTAHFFHVPRVCHSPNTIIQSMPTTTTFPRYDRLQTYAWNYDHAPDPLEVDVPAVPGQWHFCGLAVDSPLGMPAGPLLNGRRTGCRRR